MRIHSICVVQDLNLRAYVLRPIRRAEQKKNKMKNRRRIEIQTERLQHNETMYRTQIDIPYIYVYPYI